ncbi:sigma-70 family RNA polymerase sigma factor [Roseovarius autotrophicus]|uniref:sigma-70 family RNA polymerase sigma factor n=1 Tax=Roseovarius autotrophicus TaxID=2824121 RepID=UPI001B37C7B5|nr:sigma-70 family RNA polymerase sigma factor [Roseovarius autotrophicus]
MNKPYFPHNSQNRTRKTGPAMLSPEEEVRLARAWQRDGDVNARNRLLTAFGPLAHAMVARATRIRAQADPDLVQQAFLGLMRAVDRFDPDRGIRFSTYAVWWIRAELQDYRMLNWSLVRRGRSARARQAFFQLGAIEETMPPAPGESAPDRDQRIAHALGTTPGTLAQMRALFGHGDASLNAPVTEDGSEAVELLPDPDSDTEAAYAETQARTRLRAAMIRHFHTLPERERRIVVANVLQDPPLTLNDLAAVHGISRERVRQLRERGLERLRERMAKDSSVPSLV